MKKTSVFLAATLLLLTGLATAAGGGSELMHANANINDSASLQRGAKWYVNYCQSCHSIAYMRYNRLAADLGLTEQQVMDNLVFSDAKVGETMGIAMDPEQAEAWFGKAPPDLSLIARSRGTDWLYSYLLSFYKDETGSWNNTVLPNASMPNVLWSLQGTQSPVYRQVTDATGFTQDVIDHLVLTEPGSQSVDEFEQTARDITAFLEYVGEPVKLERKHVGVWVILFLALFTFIAYLLKVEYWRDVH
jgi:ubiquinol-cytochrome c reductase cytochrome c1 subunit